MRLSRAASRTRTGPKERDCALVRPAPFLSSDQWMSARQLSSPEGGVAVQKCEWEPMRADRDGHFKRLPDAELFEQAGADYTAILWSLIRGGKRKA
eukprot:6174977-Pyramimonas_sp.AAC.1